MTRRLVAALLAAGSLVACYRSGADVTASGAGRPTVTVEFPESVQPGSVERAVFDVRNPGPGDMASVFVAFTLVGAPSEKGFATPIVASGTRRGRNVVAVDPQPDAVLAGGSVYRFDEDLAEGASLTIEFRLKVPEERGVAGNSVTVYDGSEPDRARGVLLETEVAG